MCVYERVRDRFTERQREEKKKTKSRRKECKIKGNKKTNSKLDCERRAAAASMQMKDELLLIKESESHNGTSCHTIFNVSYVVRISYHPMGVCNAHWSALTFVG